MFVWLINELIINEWDLWNNRRHQYYPSFSDFKNKKNTVRPSYSLKIIYIYTFRLIIEIKNSYYIYW